MNVVIQPTICANCGRPIEWKRANPSHWTHVGDWLGKRCQGEITGARPAMTSLRELLSADSFYDDCAGALVIRCDDVPKAVIEWLEAEGVRAAQMDMITVAGYLHGIAYDLAMNVVIQSPPQDR